MVVESKSDRQSKKIEKIKKSLGKRVFFFTPHICAHCGNKVWGEFGLKSEYEDGSHYTIEYQTAYFCSICSIDVNSLIQSTDSPMELNRKVRAYANGTRMKDLI